MKNPIFQERKKNVKKPYFSGEKKKCETTVFFKERKKKCEKTLFFKREKKNVKKPYFSGDKKKNVKKPYFSGEKKKCQKTLFFRRWKKKKFENFSSPEIFSIFFFNPKKIFSPEILSIFFFGPEKIFGRKILSIWKKVCHKKKSFFPRVFANFLAFFTQKKKKKIFFFRGPKILKKPAKNLPSDQRITTSQAFLFSKKHNISLVFRKKFLSRTLTNGPRTILRSFLESTHCQKNFFLWSLN